MKYDAVFLDFYGTLVHEDDVVISEITQKISLCTPSNNHPKEISSYWWSEFRQLFENSYGADFKTQRELEAISIQKTLEHFQCESISMDIGEALFSQWVKPNIFEDTIQFLAQNVLPVCIVSNIDRNDIKQAIGFHDISFDNIVTSEDARSYKPRPEIFRIALEKMKVAPQRVLHIGDSLSSDIFSAHNCNINSFWLNRKKLNRPEGCLATYTGYSLIDVLKIL